MNDYLFMIEAMDSKGNIYKGNYFGKSENESLSLDLCLKAREDYCHAMGNKHGVILDPNKATILFAVKLGLPV